MSRVSGAAGVAGITRVLFERLTSTHSYYQSEQKLSAMSSENQLLNVSSYAAVVPMQRNAPLNIKETGCRNIIIHCEEQCPPGWNNYLRKWGYDGFHLRSEWADVFRIGLHHRPWFIRAEEFGKTVGVLPLMFISGPLFGRFLVSQPYLNTGGVLADSPEVARRLLDQAVLLAESLDVKHLELRHEQRSHSPRFQRPT